MSALNISIKENRISVRFRFFWFISLFIFLLSLPLLHTYFRSIDVEISLFSKVFTFLSPIFLWMLISIYLTFSVKISEEGFRAQANLFGFKIRQVSVGNYHLKWKELVRVYSLFPIWIPFKIIVLTFQQNGKTKTLPLGSIVTNYQEALAYIYREKPQVFTDDDVLRLIEDEV